MLERGPVQELREYVLVIHTLVQILVSLCDQLYCQFCDLVQTVSELCLSPAHCAKHLSGHHLICPQFTDKDAETQRGL